MKLKSIKPGIVVEDYYGNETTIYPTGNEWLLAFAFKGCDWAIKALENFESHRYDAEIWRGSDI
jgi:hypothetical protein